MKTTKNNIEFQIKKQIADREIAPSRDLWSEIQAKNPVEYSKTKINWLLVAACLVLTFSLSAVLFFNKENIQDPKSNIAVDSKKTENQETKPATLKTHELTEQKQKESVAIQHITSEAKSEIYNVETNIHEKQLPLPSEKAPEMMANIPTIEPEKIIAQSDSAKTPAKRKKYVDPSTLLFSVEHKDVIQKTKESNVATIDLNEK